MLAGSVGQTVNAMLKCFGGMPARLRVPFPSAPCVCPAAQQRVQRLNRPSGPTPPTTASPVSHPPPPPALCRPLIANQTHRAFPPVGGQAFPVPIGLAG